MGGVGQTASGVEVYGSPQIGVFMQGNDHTLENAHVHDAARQCSDCGVRRHDQLGSVCETFQQPWWLCGQAFYMGRDWTYRGNSILGSRFEKLSSIWGGVSAVYLDDQLSSVRIAGNTFSEVNGMVK